MINDFLFQGLVLEKHIKSLKNKVKLKIFYFFLLDSLFNAFKVESLICTVLLNIKLIFYKSVISSFI